MNCHKNAKCYAFYITKKELQHFMFYQGKMDNYTVYRATAFIVIDDHKKANQRFILSVIPIPLKHKR